MNTTSSIIVGVTAIIASSLSASAVHQTSVGSVRATNPSLTIEHPMPTSVYNQSETFGVPGWHISMLPSGYDAVDSSVGGVVLMREHEEPNIFWRWTSGHMERLGRTSEAYINNGGEIGLGNYYNGSPAGMYFLAKTWPPSSKSFDFSWQNPVESRRYIDNDTGVPYDYWFSQAQLLRLDNAGKLWVRRTVPPVVGWDGSSLETIDRYGRRQRQFLGYYDYMLGGGISKGGHWYYNTGYWSSIIDGVEVPDLAPTSISTNGIALLSYDPVSVIRYTDGTIDEGPYGQNPNWNVKWIDDQDRLMGRRIDDTGRAIACVFTKKKDPNGAAILPMEYEYTDFVPLVLANGWTTDHMIAPGTISPQLGIARRTQADGSIEERAFLALRAPELAVDADRDGTIKLASEDDTDATSAEKPFRYWINDDDDSGDTNGTDIPMGVDLSGSGPMGPANWQGSGADFKVNGARDLIDLFPVFLDIKQLVTALPPGVDVIYKLKQEESALNFVYTGLTRANAQKYQTQETDAIFGPNLNENAGQADKQWITAEGVDIFSNTKATGSQKFLDAIQNHDGGVILVEGRKATKKPLVLSVVKGDGTVIAEIKLELKLSPVEQMFRHLNLRNGPDAPSDLIGQTGDGHAAIATNMSEPKDTYPDEPGDPKWLVFVHGYNVSGQKARGWTSEMFKRFFWSQNKARFVAVTWFGNPGTGDHNIVKGYHWAVRNAVPTAAALAAKLNVLSGKKTVIGHSQGCWISALAVADYGMNVDNLCLVDAAFARECFDGENATDAYNMLPDFWNDYPAWSWSANWYRNFSTPDARKYLTWRDRLAGTLTHPGIAVHNFFSSTEDVCASFPGTPTQAVVNSALHLITPGEFSIGRYAWICQEKSKGDKALLTQGSDYAGWGFNLTDPVQVSDPNYYQIGPSGRRPLEASDIGYVILERQRRYPLFDPGWGDITQSVRIINHSIIRGPIWIEQLYDTTTDTATGSAIATVNRTELLAEAFPALSLPIGANRSNGIEDGKEYDMPVRFANPTAWPRGQKPGTGIADWHHSDIREVAYLYMSGFFLKVSELTN